MALFSFPTMDEMTEVLCNEFKEYMAVLNRSNKIITVALSGGNTPASFYDKLAAFQDIPGKRTDWSRVHLFWIDERCVPPGHPDSNFAMTDKRLLQYIRLDESQVHRIRGENEPNYEALRYEAEIRSLFDLNSDLPVFNWVFLGLGEDGHIASIFPDRPDLLQAKSFCAATRHPETGQYRVTLTGPVIMHAEKISFLVAGKAKSTIIRQIINKEPEAAGYPANYIITHTGNTDWYLDASAAQQLNP